MVKNPSNRAHKTEKALPEPPRPFHSKEAELMKELGEIRLEMDNLKKSVLSQTNIKSLEHDLSREFQKLAKEVKESMERDRHAIDKTEAEIKFLREDMKRVMSLEEQMNRLNMKTLTRDMESLKAKSHWLEGRVQVFDMDPVIERISDIEDRIKILKASQPLIIE